MIQSTPTQQFIDALYQDKPASWPILLWTLQDRTSHWATTTTKAATKALQLASEHDVYIGCGLRKAPLGPNRRGGAKDVWALPGLWLDIDIAHPTHKKVKQLPQTLDEALRIVKAIPINPTVIVHSGGGLHVWYLFKELWILEDDSEWLLAAQRASGWTHVANRMAGRYHHTVDATGSLDQILRIPGTINHKGDEQRPVRFHTVDLDQRCNPIDFDLYANESFAVGKSDITGQLIYDPNAHPPTDKLDVLRTNNPKLQQVWDRTWPDQLKEGRDQSGSGWGMVLANIVAEIPWEPQEICDLMISYHRKHGDDLKLRDSYYVKTIEKALKSQGGYTLQGLMNLNEDYEAQPSLLVDEKPEEDRERQMLSYLSAQLGVRIEQIIKYDADPEPIYCLDIEGSSIQLGHVDSLIKHSKLEHKVAAASGKMINPIKKKFWREIAQALLNVCVLKDAGPDAKHAGWIRQKMADYFAMYPVDEDTQDARTRRRPYRHKSQIQIFSSHFIRWSAIHEGDKIAPVKMGILMRMMGAIPTTVKTVTPRGNAVAARGWLIPAECEELPIERKKTFSEREGPK